MGAAGQGVAFLVSAGIVAEIIAKACSSPQTMEINADKRAPTLVKWVLIGELEAAFFVVVAAAIDRPHRGAIIAGGITEGLITWFEYQHGKTAGLAAAGLPGTET